MRLKNGLVRHRILIVLASLFLPLAAISWHDYRNLGGIGPLTTIKAYTRIFLLSAKTEYIFDQAFTEAVARNLFLGPEATGKEHLSWSKLFDSNFSPAHRRLCTKEDVFVGVTESSSNIFEVGCIPVTNPRPEDCGWFMRPTCRSLGLHISLWQEPLLQKRIIEALQNPCKYSRGQNFLDYWSSQSEQHILPMNATQSNLVGARFWAACTGETPKVTEFQVSLWDELNGVRLSQITLQPSGYTTAVIKN